jgi:hypothetical protein
MRYPVKKDKQTHKHGKRKGDSESEQDVRLIPPSSEAARDEGPRLIPLDDAPQVQDPSRLEHYLDLADVALGSGRPKRS